MINTPAKSSLYTPNFSAASSEGDDTLDPRMSPPPDRSSISSPGFSIRSHQLDPGTGHGSFFTRSITDNPLKIASTPSLDIQVKFHFDPEAIKLTSPQDIPQVLMDSNVLLVVLFRPRPSL